MSVIIALFIVIVIGYVLVNAFGGSSSSEPVKTFTCKGCGVVSNHNQRTLSAKSRGLKTFFCKDCHHSWIEKKKATEALKPQGAGCLVILFVPASLPLIDYFLL